MTLNCTSPKNTSHYICALANSGVKEQCHSQLLQITMSLYYIILPHSLIIIIPYFSITSTLLNKTYHYNLLTFNYNSAQCSVFQSNFNRHQLSIFSQANFHTAQHSFKCLKSTRSNKIIQPHHHNILNKPSSHNTHPLVLYKPPPFSFTNKYNSLTTFHFHSNSYNIHLDILSYQHNTFTTGYLVASNKGFSNSDTNHSTLLNHFQKKQKQRTLQK